MAGVLSSLRRVGAADSVIVTVGVVATGLCSSGNAVSLSSSAEKAGAGGVGGRTGSAERLPFDLRGRMEPVQPLDFFLFFLFFLLAFAGTSSPMSTADSEPCSEEPTETALGVELEELELDGRDLMGELDVVNESRPKKDQRLKVLEGLGVAGVASAASATFRRVGIELRRFGDALFSRFRGSAVRSRMAPAVLGLESIMSFVGLLDKGAGLSRPLGDAADTIEEMLPESECPGRAVAMLDVSLDTMDKGRGMNSSLSEKPTLLAVFVVSALSLGEASVFSDVSASNPCPIK
jgi:hypothetical protein